MNCLTFNIITNVLFGDDVHELSEMKRQFIKEDSTIEEVPLREFLFRLSKSHVLQLNNPLTKTVPLLNKYNYMGQLKKDHQNKVSFRAGLKEMLHETKDEKSIFSHVKQRESYSDQQLLDDLILFMVGGTETSSHTVTSIFYFLKKSPEKLHKLTEELRENGFTKDANFEELFTKEKLNNLSYLNNVIKEGLRMDSPATMTFEYEALEDINI